MAEEKAGLRVVLMFFAANTLFLFLLPLDPPLGRSLRDRWAPIDLAGIAHPVVISAAAWGLCAVGIGLMTRLCTTVSKNARLVLIRYLLLVFLYSMVLERLADSAALWAEGLLPVPLIAWVELVCCITIGMAAALALPKARNIRQLLATAQSEHARFIAAAENTLDDFYIFDGVPDATGTIVDFRFSYINPNAERRLHVAREKLIGRVLTEVRPFMIRSGLIEKYREVVRTGQPFITEVYLDDEMIKATWLKVQVVKLGDGIAITSRDITEDKRLAERIQHLAHHDALTGLANRNLFHDRLRQALLRAQRHQQKVALFMLDVDHFKRINDTLGHSGGDALLTMIGKRLVAAVRETDTVARIGGDEFVVITPDFQHLEDVRNCGQKILESVAQPIEVGGYRVVITVSIGACVFPDSGLDIEELLKNADSAMYEIKERGRNGLEIFQRREPGESLGFKERSSGI